MRNQMMMMLRSRSAAWILGLGLALSAACGSEGAPTGTGSGSIVVRNQSTGVTVSDLRIYRCDASNAGPNRLSGMLNPGTEVSVSVSAGCYEVRAFPADNLNQTTRVFSNVAVASGETETLVVTDTP
jgi:hypothetical protein